MIKNVLTALDGSPYAHTVLDYAKYFSEKFNSLIKVIHVIDIRMYEWTVSLGMDGFSTVMPSASFQEESRLLLEKRGEEIISRAESFLRKNNISHELIKEHGVPVEVIAANGKVADLIIMGVRGEYAKWSKKFLGTVTEAVSRETHRPILYVQNNFKAFSKILLPYDGSEHAGQALSYSAFMAEKLEIPVVLLTSHHDEVIASELMHEALSYFHPYNVIVEEVTTKGHPDKDILKVQEEKKCDLIIMGAYGHSRIREAIIGSVPIQVLRAANVPVMLVK